MFLTNGKNGLNHLQLHTNLQAILQKKDVVGQQKASVLQM